MKEAFENAEAKPREKLKVTKADIVVACTPDKPYFNIHYREVGNDYDNIGYGSYDLNNVFKWREEEMEIVSEVEAEYGNGWIPCSERLPREGQTVLASINSSNAIHKIILAPYEESLDYWYDGTIIAWMPLPAPYKGVK